MAKKSNVKVRYAQIPGDIESIEKLWFDYLVWGNHKMEELYGVHPHNPEEAVEQEIQQINNTIFVQLQKV